MCCPKNTTPEEEADPAKAEENKIEVKDLDRTPTPKKKE
jgi:hypothetical protein